MKKDVGADNVLYVHFTLIPYVGPWAEVKTKPTQHSVIKLREIGIQPDVLICRTRLAIDDDMKEKISLFCDVGNDAVIVARETETVYEIPLVFEEEGLADLVVRQLALPVTPAAMDEWKALVRRVRQPAYDVRIAVVGKYTNLLDSYKSLAEALNHGGIANRVRVRLDWVDSQIFEQPDTVERLEDVHGILVPGGFGERRSEGKIAAVGVPAGRNIPVFGICFGMQMAVIECARNLAGLADASSTEFGPSTEPVVGLLTEWARGNEMERRAEGGELGGTMRLGSYPAHLQADSLVRDMYSGAGAIAERHRHRYEVNVHYRERLEATGLVFSGMSPDGILPEIVEYPDHPWFIGVQYHPELKSKPFDPHPLFAGFIAASVRQARLV